MARISAVMVALATAAIATVGVVVLTGNDNPAPKAPTATTTMNQAELKRIADAQAQQLRDALDDQADRVRKEATRLKAEDEASR